MKLLPSVVSKIGTLLAGHVPGPVSRGVFMQHGAWQPEKGNKRQTVCVYV